MMNEKLFLSRAVWGLNERGGKTLKNKHKDSTGPMGSAIAYIQQWGALLACVKFSSNFDGVQRSKRNYIHLLCSIQIIFTSWPYGQFHPDAKWKVSPGSTPHVRLPQPLAKQDQSTSCVSVSPQRHKQHIIHVLSLFQKSLTLVVWPLNSRRCSEWHIWDFCSPRSPDP